MNMKFAGTNCCHIDYKICILFIRAKKLKTIGMDPWVKLD